ncbi:MAG: class I SAM-dependent methyltransferase [Verrucomicrobia bacterium]|nr:class I SAM-dependent methyltransferase [Verrucomicrobiota bacterium]
MITSTSENNGLALLTDQDLQIYSIGISSAGSAEIRMAKIHPARRITASTIDLEGAEFAQRIIQEQHLSDQITIKIESIIEKLPYADAFFDFIYARLVLHYLSKDQLTLALKEIFRVLKKGGKFYVVVRSTNCPDAKDPKNTHDLQTGMTTYISPQGYSFTRFFHTKETIQDYLKSAGFQIQHVNAYQEQLCSDFQRTQLATSIDALIEVLAIKPL